MGTCPRSFFLFLLAPLLAGCVQRPDEDDGDGPHNGTCSSGLTLTQPTTIRSPSELGMLAEYTAAEAPVRFEGDLLVAVDGINCLQTGDSISFAQASLLQSVRGFPALTQLSGGLTFDRNPVLQSVVGFGQLQQISGSLTLAELPQVSDLSGFGRLLAVGDLVVRDNQNMVDFSGFESLGAVRGNLLVTHNASLVDVSGLDAVQRVVSQLEFSNNASLAVIDGFPALNEVGNLFLSKNPALTTLSGFPLLTQMGSLTVEDNPLLSDISALSAVTTAQQINIQVTALPDVTGLASLEVVEERLRITDNENLTSLAGLESLRSISALVVTNNPNLPTCEVRDLIDRLETPPSQPLVDGNLSDECDGDF